MQIDKLILARRSDKVLIDKKKNCDLLNFAVPANQIGELK